MTRIWFLNVGHGDCTIIEHPSGRITMIDINNSQDYDDESETELLNEQFAKGFMGARAIEASNAQERSELCDPVTFFKNTFGTRSIFRFILSHPDLDHMRGLKRLFSEVGVTNFWDVAHTKPTPSFRSEADRIDWDFYQHLRGGGAGIGVKNYYRGASVFALNREENGGSGGDGIELLSPTPQLVSLCNQRGVSNDLSYVLSLSYAGKRAIFPGDAEALAWDDMVATYGPGLKVDVLKASHHGRDSGFHLKAVQAMKPAVAITSVGRKPTTDAHSKYAHHCTRVMSTRRHGNICVSIDRSGSWTIQVDRNAG